MEGSASVSSTMSLSGAATSVNLIEAGAIKREQDSLQADASALNLTLENAGIGFWMYTNNIDKLQGGDVCIDSLADYVLNAASDPYSLTWYFNTSVLPQLAEDNTWTWVVLRASDAINASVHTDATIADLFANVSYFRLHFGASAACDSVLKLDDVRIINLAASEAPAYDGTDTRVGLGSGEYMSFEGPETAEDAPPYYQILNFDNEITCQSFPWVLDTSSNKEGSACLSYTGSGFVQFFAGMSDAPYGQFGNSVLMQSEMAGRKIEYSYEDACLGFWFYYGNSGAYPVASLSTGLIELSSNHNSDTNMLTWDLSKFKSFMVDDGWCYIYLPFTDASVKGNFDFSNVNYFRIYLNVSTHNTQIKIDDLRIFNRNDPYNASILEGNGPDYTQAVPAGSGDGYYTTAGYDIYVYDRVSAGQTELSLLPKAYELSVGKVAGVCAACGVVIVGSGAAAAVLVIRRKRRSEQQ